MPTGRPDWCTGRLGRGEPVWGRGAARISPVEEWQAVSIEMIAKQTENVIEPCDEHFFFPFLADFLLSFHPECAKQHQNASAFFVNANCPLEGLCRSWKYRTGSAN